METYYILIAIILIFRSLSLGNIIQIIFLRLLYPNATIKEVENFIKKTKTKFRFPKLWK